jgi:putative DNA primase/helicase
MTDPLSQFRDAIRAAELEPPEVIEPDGKLHRFPTNGKRGDDSGWYVLHLDGIPAGAFGDWRTGLSETWRADIGRHLSPEEEAAYRAHVETLRRQREAEEARYRTEAARKAKAIWEAAAPATENHPYLVTKRLNSYGLRVHSGKLIVPMREGDALHSLQFIAQNGDKRFLTGGRVAGCYFLIGEPDGVLCIAEGYATAAAIYEAAGYAVAIAFNAGNLLPVAKTLRARFPGLRIIVCANDDYRSGNLGKTKASEAAGAIEGLLAMPDFGESKPDWASDFNDLMVSHGLEAVRRCIELATTPDEAIKAVIKRLSALPLIKYDQTREVEAQRLGIRSIKKSLRRAVRPPKKAREGNSSLRAWNRGLSR